VQRAILDFARADSVLAKLGCADRVRRDLALVDAVLREIYGSVGNAAERKEQCDVRDRVASKVGMNPAGDGDLL
jgi:hypothetical protein